MPSRVLTARHNSPSNIGISIHSTHHIRIFIGKYRGINRKEGWVGPAPVCTNLHNINSLTLPGIRTPYRPAGNYSLYRQVTAVSQTKRLPAIYGVRRFAAAHRRSLCPVQLCGIMQRALYFQKETNWCIKRVYKPGCMVVTTVSMNTTACRDVTPFYW
jgi:hypothetical protein